MRLIIPIIIIVSAAGYFAQEQLKSQGEILAQKGNALEKYDVIRVFNPLPGSLVKSPILLEGIARGYWFPEGDFSVKIFDAMGKELGSQMAYATRGGAGEEFILFHATVVFMQSSMKEGVVILKKANPAGFTAMDDELRIPVRFQE